MALEVPSEAWRKAAALNGGMPEIEGPLRGYHHETYVVSLAGRTTHPEGVRWKCREPRPGLFWFDRRCFVREEPLVGALKDYVTRVPEIIEVEGVLLQRFVEGVTLGARYRSATQVPERFQRQIMQVFADLAAVRPEMVSVERRCAPEDRTDEGDSAGFLERLMHFMEVNVYQGHLGEFGSLFQALGVHDVAFKFLRDRVEGLRSRPFHLLHADLHRENLIIDRRGQLWPIDWELAMFGDPLYDLATHLHLMRYPKEQERRVVSLWRDVMRTARMAGAAGLTRDLPLLLDFKRAQSVFTDVIRTALTLREVTDVVKRAALLQVSAGKLHWVLERGAAPMGLGHVPSARSVGVALQRWLSWGVNDH